MRVPSEVSTSQFLEQKRLLEMQLNRMTRNADWAVMGRDPINRYHRADSILG